MRRNVKPKTESYIILIHDDPFHQVCVLGFDLSTALWNFFHNYQTVIPPLGIIDFHAELVSNRKNWFIEVFYRTNKKGSGIKREKVVARKK